MGPANWYLLAEDRAGHVDDLLRVPAEVGHAPHHRLNPGEVVLRFTGIGRHSVSGLAARIASRACFTVTINVPSSSSDEADSRAANSAGRSRSSGLPPTPLTINCCTFPVRCSTRLPIEFMSGPGPRTRLARR